MKSISRTITIPFVCLIWCILCGCGPKRQNLQDPTGLATSSEDTQKTKIKENGLLIVFMRWPHP